MCLEKYRTLINDTAGLSKDQIFIASLKLANDYFEHATCEDFLTLLRVSSEVFAAKEQAALALYRKTKRPRISNVPYEDFDTDYQSWKNYLLEHDLLEC